MRCRWALAALLLLTACSDSGGNNTPTVPVLAWGGFRHDQSNSATGNGISGNKAASLACCTPPTAKRRSRRRRSTTKVRSTWACGTAWCRSTIQGGVRWFADSCEASQRPGHSVRPDQSSPTVTPGRDIVFGTDATATTNRMVFDLHERSRTVVECRFAFPTGIESVRSSAQVQVDPRDLSLLSVFIGTGRGRCKPSTASARRAGPSNRRRSGCQSPASNAIDPNGPFYITTPDGVLGAADASQQAVPLAVPNRQPAFRGAAAVASLGPSIYAIGAGSALFGINLDGTLKWQFSPNAEVPGSPAFASQSIDVGSNLILDTIIYLVDVNGEISGVRDTNGELWEMQFCCKDPPDPDIKDQFETCRYRQLHCRTMGDVRQQQVHRSLLDQILHAEHLQSEWPRRVSPTARVNLLRAAHPCAWRRRPFSLVTCSSSSAPPMDGSAPATWTAPCQGDDDDMSNPWVIGGGYIELFHDDPPVRRPARPLITRHRPGRVHLRHHGYGTLPHQMIARRPTVISLIALLRPGRVLQQQVRRPASLNGGTSLARDGVAEVQADPANSGRSTVDLSVNDGMPSSGLVRPGIPTTRDRSATGHDRADAETTPILGDNIIYLGSSDTNVYVLQRSDQPVELTGRDHARQRRHRLAAPRCGRDSLRPQQRHPGAVQIERRGEEQRRPARIRGGVAEHLEQRRHRVRRHALRRFRRDVPERRPPQHAELPDDTVAGGRRQDPNQPDKSTPIITRGRPRRAGARLQHQGAAILVVLRLDDDQRRGPRR